jgi:hypothetical protein
MVVVVSYPYSCLRPELSTNCLAARNDRPEWRPYGNDWDRPGYQDRRPWDDRPRGGNPWQTTTIIGYVPTVPVWYGNDWEIIRPPPRTIYTTYDPIYYNNQPPPWIAYPVPRGPAITINLPAPPRFGCSVTSVTFESIFEDVSTWTDTITQPPQDAVITVYVDEENGETSTDWGPVETVYEVFVYTTTATVDVVSATTACGIF